jgi:alkane 1-monooxygenase
MRTKTLQRGIHPYVIYLGISALALASAFLLGGFAGVTALLTLSIYAQLQLLLSDYVQHYGLRRTTVGGRLEPVGPQHSWNAPHAYSGAMMLNAPRHSDHHASPGKPYGDLVITPQDMPVLPRSLPVMATIALVPPLWHWMMDKRAAKWSTQSREAVTKNTAIAGADDRVLSG